MSRGVSIIICCYNSVSRLPETLKHLSLQQTSVSWEVIVVNNNSTDATSQVANEEWDKSFSPTTLRIVHEPTPGLAAARNKGIAEAKYDYLIYCDDDNWLAPTYVADVYELFEKDSTIGIIGGNGSPVTEGEAPFWFEKFVHSYAAFPQTDSAQFVGGVYGAGMAIRKECYTSILENKFESLLTDRKGTALSSGGDSELCYLVRLAGYKIWCDNRLQFKHFIPRSRLQWDYLKRLHIGFAKSNVVINLYDFAVTTDCKQLPKLYWVKRAGYYLGIYLKYWPKQYSVYKKGIGSGEEILHITWRTIGLEYIKHNFRTIGYYNRILAMKKKFDGK